MTPMLTWDLHVHPGTAADGRWGDGPAVQESARRAGVKGLVWKTHAGSSLSGAAALLGPPYVLPSISLNPATGLPDLARALDAGVRWIWSPSRQADSALGWELPLPKLWPAKRDVLEKADGPLVIATSHLGPIGRAEVAEMCATRRDRLCTVTHSLYLDDDEIRRLADLGVVFEVDLFTLIHTVREWPRAELGPRVALVHELGSTIYLTSDAGQSATGDPYEFVAGALAELAAELGAGVEELAERAPERVISHLVPIAVAGPEPT
jgi:hypothetical protein